MERDKSSRRSIDKADAIKKRFMLDNQSACFIEKGENMVTIVINFIGKLFIVQRMTYPITKPKRMPVFASIMVAKLSYRYSEVSEKEGPDHILKWVLCIYVRSC